jgi:glycosyltransferase involved in cell wall biosynthesis
VARVLLVSNEPVGRTMAGPGIRYRQFALQLADRFDVTLVIPNDPDEALPGVRLVRAQELGYRRFVQFAESFDAIVAQQLTIATMERLARRGARVVYDLYDPLLFEALAYHQSDDHAGAYAGPLSRAAMLKQILALSTGSAFLCASDRQRDLWLGVLSSLGRIGFNEFDADPSLDRLVVVVPFGIEPQPPRAETPALKGVLEGIGREDRVLLWGGGVWNWLDPLTPIRAVAELAKHRDDVRLVFLGIRHPSPRIPEMAMAQAAVNLAGQLGVLDSKVYFNFEWVPYTERARFLLDADLGVSAHFDTVETRFAFRTRLLDYLWANLPSVVTRGDALGDRIGDRGLGRAVGFEAVDEWVEAISILLDDSGEFRVAKERIIEEREAFLWPRVVEPLADLLAGPLPPARYPPRIVGPLFEYLWAALAGTVRRRGVRGAAREVVSVLRRPDVP